LLTKLKKKVQDMLTSEAKAAHKIGLTPNIVSLIGLALAFFSAAAYAIAQNQPMWLLLAVILLLASGFCDALDGVIARIYQQQSVFGGFLDSLLDRYADAVVYAGVIIGGLCDLLWGLAALAGSLLVSYSRARAEAAGIKMESVGVAERAERMIILAVASSRCERSRDFFASSPNFWVPKHQRPKHRDYNSCSALKLYSSTKRTTRLQGSKEKGELASSSIP